MVTQTGTLNCNRGTSKSIKCTIKENGAVKDITGYTVIFTVKETPDTDQTDAKAIIKKVVTTGTDFNIGIARIVLTKDDTEVDDGTYVYNVRILAPGSASVLDTANGKFNVTLGATQQND